MLEKNPILLGVNVDHIATIRQTRHTRYPDPVLAACAAEEAGADGITVHLREDRRHIQERDVEILSQTLQTRMNLEMAATPAMLAYAENIQPQHCCLVPEKREELTTEGGLDVHGNITAIREACQRLRAANVLVSLFIDPEVKQIEAALECAAPIIELHTGCYANATTTTQQAVELQRIATAATLAHKLGLQVNAGHGLHYHNVQAIARLPEIIELNIGHGIISRALFVGIKTAVSDMKHIMLEARAA